MNERETLDAEIRQKESLKDCYLRSAEVCSKRILEMEQQLADLDAKDVGPWKPTTGEEYYFDLFSESPGESLWSNRGVDHYRWSLGNVYRTRDLAEAAKRWRLIDVRVRRAAEASGKTKKHWWSITMSDESGAEVWARHSWPCGEPKFATDESAQDCIDDIGEGDISFWLMSR